MWKWILFGAMSVVSVGGIIYGLVTRKDPCALLGITEFDPQRIPIHLLPDPALSFMVRTALKQAAEFWNENLGALVFITGTVVPRGSVVSVMPYDGTEPYSVRKKFGWARLTLTTNQKGISSASVRLNVKQAERVGRQTLVLALVHELGHVLGLAHDDDTWSIMYPTLSNSEDAYGMRKLTDQDRKFLCRVYALGNVPEVV